MEIWSEDFRQDLQISIATGQTDVRGILRGTADDLGATGKDDYYGYGLVDAEEAATGAQIPAAPPLTPKDKLAISWAKIKTIR